jgi:hypothetical protein
MTREDALEVAKMAVFAGSQLKTIDSYTSERTNNPANKIDINRFIAPIKNPNIKLNTASYLNQYPNGFAPPPPEDYIQNAEPDRSIGGTLTTVHTNELQQVPVSLPIAVPANLPVEDNSKKPEKLKTITQQDSVLTRNDIDSIKNSLKNINNSLKGIIEVLKSK